MHFYMQKPLKNYFIKKKTQFRFRRFLLLVHLLREYSAFHPNYLSSDILFKYTFRVESTGIQNEIMIQIPSVLARFGPRSSATVA